MSEQSWHLSKSVPVALILAIGIQTIGVVWWASNITATVAQQGTNLRRAETQIEIMRATSQTQAIQLSRIEENMNGMRGDLARIVRLLEQRD